MRFNDKDRVVVNSGALAYCGMHGTVIETMEEHSVRVHVDVRHDDGGIVIVWFKDAALDPESKAELDPMRVDEGEMQS